MAKRNEALEWLHVKLTVVDNLSILLYTNM
jgi:hypothetical protein